MSEVKANGANGQKAAAQVVEAPKTEVQQQPEAKPTAMQTVPFVPESATDAWQLAKYYAQSNLLPPQIKSVGDIFVTVMAGRDFGWSPMQALRGIYVVEGKPSLSADAKVAIVKRSGLCKFFRLIKSDATEAVYETHREGDPEPVQMGFTIKEAEEAGLLAKKGPWHTYRRRMLRNRAKSVLCHEVYEDLFFGTYEESEGLEVDELRHAAPAPATKGSEGLKATLKASEVTIEAAPPQAKEVVPRTSPPTAEELADARRREAEEAAAQRAE